jgi:uncharacterized protein YxjI
MSDLAHLQHFFVSQRITMMVNRYEIRVAAPDGSEGPVAAVAQQKRLAFKEQVSFYADESRKELAFGFRARHRIDLGATYDVIDADGQPIGWFRKQFGRSLLRSTWELSTVDGGTATGSERSPGVAIARRLWEMLPIVENLPSPFVFHFDFTDESGMVVMTSERQRTLSDRYVVTVPEGRVDGRVAAAMAVALDALQSR